jgi:hypothetical protein
LFEPVSSPYADADAGTLMESYGFKTTVNMEQAVGQGYLVDEASRGPRNNELAQFSCVAL